MLPTSLRYVSTPGQENIMQALKHRREFTEEIDFNLDSTLVVIIGDVPKEMSKTDAMLFLVKNYKAKSYNILNALFYQKYSDEFILKALKRAHQQKRFDLLDVGYCPKAFEILLNAGEYEILSELPSLDFDEDNSHLIYNLVPSRKLALVEKLFTENSKEIL